MVSRPTTPGLLLRCTAAFALSVWIAAQALCFAHCNFAAGQAGSGEISCHNPAPARSESTKSCCPSPHESSASSVCTTLKSALVGSGPTTQFPPDLPLLYTLAPLALDATTTVPSTSFFREVETRDGVSTPEVFLGPAHRSHAPPSLG